MQLVKGFVSNLRHTLYCLFLALTFAASQYYLIEDYFAFSPAYFGEVLLYYLGFALLDYLLRLGIRTCSQLAGKRTWWERRMNGKGAAMLTAGIIFLFWLPSLISLYPGTVINDTWGQMMQYVDLMDGANALYDHHPVLSTLIMGGLITRFEALTGDWHLAFFLYVLVQAMATALSFGAAVVYAHRKLQIGGWASFLMFAIFCLLPLYPASIQTISKDALSAWAFVLFALLFMEAVRSRGECLRSPGYIAAMIVTALFCSLTKKVNVYVILLSLVVLLIGIPGNRGFLLIPMLAIAGVMFCLVPALFAHFHVEPGGKQEMFSIPFQQTARYVREHPEDMTEEEQKAIDHLLDLSDLVERYNPVSADGVKGFWELGETKDYVEYMKAWAAEGIRHPVSYLDALNAMLAGWFSFEECDPVMDMSGHSQLNAEFFSENVTERTGIFATMAEAFMEEVHSLHRNPALRLFFTYGFYAAILPLFALSLTREKKNGLWLALLPMFGTLILGCFLAPVSTYSEGRRYLYPLTYTMPLVLAYCIYATKNAGQAKADLRESGGEPRY
ncbi:MAG: hypothetical protein IJ719_13390 [Clostridia bacterium]|nr:hypothetical protein [Clostridia bacterium]